MKVTTGKSLQLSRLSRQVSRQVSLPIELFEDFADAITFWLRPIPAAVWDSARPREAGFTTKVLLREFLQAWVLKIVKI